jgi:hypothetical protein
MGSKLKGVRGDPGLVLAATYRVGTGPVVSAGGVPSRTRAYVADVGRYARRYAARPAE